MQVCDSLSILWHCLSLGLEWKLTFSVLWSQLRFPNLSAYWRQHFTASSFRIWNSSTGIPSPPLGLFIVMLPKAHLTSHSRMSDSRLVITPSWLSWLWRSFLYSSSVYSCYLFLISSASVRSIPFLSFIEPIFACNVPLVSLIFLKRSLVPLPFLNPAWTSGSSWVHILLKPGLENFEHYFTSLWNECNCVVVWIFFGIAFLRDWNENWLFPVLWPLLSFPNLLTYWVQYFNSIIL